MRSTVWVLPVTPMSALRVSTLLAIGGGLVGLALFWVVLRRQLAADAASPTRLRGFNLISAIIGITAVGAALLPYVPPTSESVNILFIALVFVIGAMMVLPRDKLLRSVGAFAFGVALLLIRHQVFEYAEKKVGVFGHVIPLMYLAIVLALFLSAGIYVVKNVRLSKF